MITEINSGKIDNTEAWTTLWLNIGKFAYNEVASWIGFGEKQLKLQLKV